MSEEVGSCCQEQYEHLDGQALLMLNNIIGSLKSLSHGNGRIVLIISGGNICDLETTTRVAIKHEKKPT